MNYIYIYMYSKIKINDARINMNYIQIFEKLIITNDISTNLFIKYKLDKLIIKYELLNEYELYIYIAKQKIKMCGLKLYMKVKFTNFTKLGI